LVWRPEVPLWIAVTFQAPGQLEGLRRPGQRHPVDLPMASRAADALLDVDAVVEVDEVAQDVDPIPLQRLTALEALADRLQHRAPGPDLRVAVHAGLGRGHAGERGLLHRGVAVPTVDPVVADMMLVTEWHRLVDRYPLRRHVG